MGIRLRVLFLSLQINDEVFEMAIDTAGLRTSEKGMGNARGAGNTACC